MFISQIFKYSRGRNPQTPVLFHVGHAIYFALWACPVRVLARTENFNNAPINVGTAHISHGTVYIRRRYAPLILPFLSALVLIYGKRRYEDFHDWWQRRGRGYGPTALFRATGERSYKSQRGPFQGLSAPPVPPGDGHLACFRCLGLLSRHLFFSQSVDLAEAIAIFRAGVPEA